MLRKIASGTLDFTMPKWAVFEGVVLCYPAGAKPPEIKEWGRRNPRRDVCDIRHLNAMTRKNFWLAQIQ